MNITDIKMSDDAQINTPEGVRVMVAVLVLSRGTRVCVWTGTRERATMVLKCSGSSADTAARAVMRSFGVPRKTAASIMRSAHAAAHVQN